MNILDQLNSGAIHAVARASRPDCVDASGNIHVTPERARFVSWKLRMSEMYGATVSEWPQAARDEYAAKYVPSH